MQNKVCGDSLLPHLESPEVAIIYNLLLWIKVIGGVMLDKTEKKIYGILLLVLAVLALLLAYFFLPPAADAAPSAKDNSITVNVAPLQKQSVTVKKQYIGYVTPINSVAVIPYINGFLDKIYVKGGQEVKTGETLIVIRQDEYKAKVDQAHAAVLSAEADYNNAAVFYKRNKAAGQRAISKTELDNAKARYLSAQAALAEAKANYTLAQVNYGYTTIKAPIDGVVGNVDLSVGDYVSPASQPLLTIIQYNPIRVVFSITDKDYLDEMAQNGGRLFADEKIRLKLSNGSMYALPGEVKYLDNAVDRSTNSIAVYADFPNAEKVLVANAYVDVVLERSYADGVLIKQNLVSMEPDGNYIYLVRNNQINKAKIKIIAPHENDYLVTDHFKPGDYIVLDKISGINAKSKIKINVVQPAKAVEKK